MGKIERQKLLNDQWPTVSNEKKKVIIQVIKKASKAKVFDYKPEQKELIVEK